MGAVVRVGPAGWAYDDWKGIVYPKGMPRSEHPAAFLARYFDTIEINVSFYRPLNPKHCAAWIRQVEGNPNFRFTAKLWQRFTHERDTWPDSAEVNVVKEGLKPLAESGKLGALLVQFPWSFKRTTDSRKWLGHIVETFGEFPLAVEIRHNSWNRPEVFSGLAERGVAFCNIDQPVFANSIAPTDKVTAPLGYVRLHGRNAKEWFREDAGRDNRYDYLYNEQELSEWLRKIERIRDMAEEVYAITNNHYRGQAVVNALEMQAGLGVLRGESLPDSLVETYPRLAGLKNKKD